MLPDVEVLLSENTALGDPQEDGLAVVVSLMKGQAVSVSKQVSALMSKRDMPISKEKRESMKTLSHGGFAPNYKQHFILKQ